MHGHDPQHLPLSPDRSSLSLTNVTPLGLSPPSASSWIRTHAVYLWRHEPCLFGWLRAFEAVNVIRRRCANFHLGPGLQKMTPHNEAEYMAATGISKRSKRSCNLARRENVKLKTIEDRRRLAPSCSQNFDPDGPHPLLIPMPACPIGSDDVQPSPPWSRT